MTRKKRLNYNSSQGKIEEHLTPGISKSDFSQRLIHTLTTQDVRKNGQQQLDQAPTGSGSDSSHGAPASSAPAQPSSTPQSIANPNPTSPNSNPYPSETLVNPESTTPHGTPGSTVYTQPSSSSSQPRSATIPAPKPKPRSPPQDPQPTTPPQQNSRKRNNEYAQQRLRANQEARAERDRVRALVESDKAERQRKAQEQQAARRLASSAPLQPASAAAEDAEANARSEVAGRQRAADLEKRTTRAGCALQVRLLDGSTIRRRFEARDTLRGAVREWIDSDRGGGGGAYGFKLVLTPQSRGLTAEEEGRMLKELGLVPSASLVLVRRKGVDVVGGAKGVGMVPGALVGCVAGLWAWLVGVFWMLFGFSARIGVREERGREKRGLQSQNGSVGSDGAGAADESGGSSTAVNSAQRKGKMRIRTLRDQRDDREDQQLYNGNTVSVSLHLPWGSPRTALRHLAHHTDGICSSTSNPTEKMMTMAAAAAAALDLSTEGDHKRYLV